MSGTSEEEIGRAIVEASRDGRIECGKALALASELGVSARVVGETANKMGVKISRCQLGCFGWK